jgi:hypothetical protein
MCKALFYETPGPSIVHLPPKLMDLIFPHLPKVAQACLALSCKRLYHPFGYILKAPIFQNLYSNRLDTDICLKTRSRFLRRHESQPQGWWSGLFQESRSRKYCYAYLMAYLMAFIKLVSTSLEWIRPGLWLVSATNNPDVDVYGQALLCSVRVSNSH